MSTIDEFIAVKIVFLLNKRGIIVTLPTLNMFYYIYEWYQVE